MNNHAPLDYDEIMSPTIHNAEPKPECKCTLRGSLVGDGCPVCQPDTWADMLREDEPPKPGMLADFSFRLVDGTYFVSSSDMSVYFSVADYALVELRDCLNAAIESAKQPEVRPQCKTTTNACSLCEIVEPVITTKFSYADERPVCSCGIDDEGVCGQPFVHWEGSVNSEFCANELPNGNLCGHSIACHGSQNHD